MNYFELVCVYPSRCKALAPTRLVAPPTDRGHRPYRNADGRYERAGVGEFPPSPNARFFCGRHAWPQTSYIFKLIPSLHSQASLGQAKSAWSGVGTTGEFARTLPVVVRVMDEPPWQGPPQVLMT
jgi:hypothetical protein